jgi:SAM-dependent methyltransferase
LRGEAIDLVLRISQASCVARGGVARFYGRRGEYEYHRCAACGTIQLVPLPTREELERAYAEIYATTEHINPDPARSRQEARSHHEAILRALMDHQVGDDVAEVGAGWGGLAQLLIESGFRYEGVEPSEAMAAHCRSLGLPIQQGEVDALFGKTYSALVMCSVFEHFVEHEQWLRKANRLLQVGGILISGQPTAHFLHFAASIVRLGRTGAPLPKLHQGFCPPWHTVLFSISGMEALLTRRGFELVEIRPMPQGQILGITGWAQRGLECVNKAAWPVFGIRWPLLIGHLFVFRKIRNES